MVYKDVVSTQDAHRGCAWAVSLAGSVYMCMYFLLFLIMAIAAILTLSFFDFSWSWIACWFCCWLLAPLQCLLYQMKVLTRKLKCYLWKRQQYTHTCWFSSLLREFSPGFSGFPPGGGGISIAQVFKENMKLNWKFQGVGGSKPKNHPWGRYGYFLEPHIIITLPLNYWRNFTSSLLSLEQTLWSVIIIT